MGYLFITHEIRTNLLPCMRWTLSSSHCVCNVKCNSCLAHIAEWASWWICFSSQLLAYFYGIIFWYLSCHGYFDSLLLVACFLPWWHSLETGVRVGEASKQTSHTHKVSFSTYHNPRNLNYEISKTNYIILKWWKFTFLTEKSFFLFSFYFHCISCMES